MKSNMLIIEDHELTRFGLKTAFEGCDFIDKIFEADSAEAFCEKSGKNRQFPGNIYSPPLAEAGGEKHNTNGDDETDEQVRSQFRDGRLTRQHNRKESQQSKNELKQLKRQIGILRI